MYHKLWCGDIHKMRRVEMNSIMNNNNKNNVPSKRNIPTHCLFFGECKDPIFNIRVLGVVVGIEYKEGNETFSVVLDDTTDCIIARFNSEKHESLIKTKQIRINRSIEVFGSIKTHKKGSNEFEKFIQVKYVQYKDDATFELLRDLEIIHNYKDYYLKSLGLLGAQSYSRKKENLLVDQEEFENEDINDLMALDQDTDLETVRKIISENDGISLKDLIAKFANNKSNMKEIIDNLSESGMIYENGGKYYPL